MIPEIDPAVYHATKTYFNLEAFQKVNVEDGFHSVTKRARQIKKGGSDYNLEDLADLVIHDCFTGGSVPIALYTEQFWADLTLSIKATGHLVVVGSS